MSEQKNAHVIPVVKHIALIAHDSRKQDMIRWCDENKESLGKHFLYGTGTTAKMISEATELPVRGVNSGPLGGDQQIGSKIVEGEINFMIFFWDPLSMHPHDPDVKALLRIATLYNIPIATNIATADYLLTSVHMNQPYEGKLIDFDQYLNRKL
ncbi:methylglyoxal synthase [Fusibacter ferrireducens]|uniref:Methylglyoxal synthase n=1 Tax=Fusibacter ferrireducens TaxID=2785058 RepID=A0ABR9ZTC4_9FIRM|nr:methylglyoxal synthase [Fusibacter ferrireducens]MBF4693692.1 methylglyoxal synthase [Fusibacter ferrireducens]